MIGKLTTPNVLRRTIVVLFVLLAGAMYVVIGKNGNENKENPFAQYTEKISKTYDLKFGENPFLPSNATTVTGSFIPGEYFIASSRCAKCHAGAHAQWQKSAHRNAFREPFYQKNVKDLINQRGIEYTRHCESCHNPAALFTGALTKDAKLPRPFDEDGVSCIACHSIEQATGQGIGGYVMGIPALLVKEDGTRLHKASDQQIMDDVPSHRRAMMRPLLKSQEFCASCHKSQVPHQLNDYKFLRAFAVGDEYQMSSFSKESPHPFYVRDKETCNSCHMKKESVIKYDAVAAAR
ncbi:MAG TPA: multiheme c-type cytochrome, partial [Blastocatellia bacterium]|nr:multiheme c-type cytochrome [Blastocatellia bacterium]